MAHWKFLLLCALQTVLVISQVSGQLTTSGTNCSFPFTYRGVTYNSCTTKNHDRPWCSVTTSYDGKWGDCAGFAKSNEETTGGENCAFPFIYKGVEYKSCTSTGHHRPWCSIAVNYDVDVGKWGDCQAFESSGKKTKSGEFCVFPFRLNGTEYKKCITKDNSKSWCSTTANFDKDKKGETCEDSGPQMTTSGKNCSFPFIYKGVTYNSCTTKSHDRPWCSTTRFYEGKWGDCAGFTKSDESTTGGEYCAFPFTYKGEVYKSCTSVGHDRPWCSIAVNYAVDVGKWGNCGESSGVKTVEGEFCVLPFRYNGEEYESCITKGKKNPWCSTTSNYDKDKKSGLCKGFFIDSSNTTSGNYCAFPFIYRGHHYNTCTSKNHDRLWCSTTTNYDEDKKWENCA